MHLICRELLKDCRQKLLILNGVGQNLSVKVWPDGQQMWWNLGPSQKPRCFLDLLTALLSRKQLHGRSPTWYGGLWPQSRWANDHLLLFPWSAPDTSLGRRMQTLAACGRLQKPLQHLPCLPACLPTIWCSSSLAFWYFSAAKVQGQDFLV